MGLKQLGSVMKSAISLSGYFVVFSDEGGGCGPWRKGKLSQKS